MCQAHLLHAGSAGLPSTLQPTLRPGRHRSYLRQQRGCAAAATAQKLQVDFAVVGGGIIGLCIAHAILLKDKKASVALVEKGGLCAGATGAGQGYVWMAHRDPASPLWSLAARSKHLWQGLVDSDPAWRKAIEWQDIGSILLGRTKDEQAGLGGRQTMLAAAGVSASLLNDVQLRNLEPSLGVSPGSSGLLVETDVQLNGRRAAETLQAACVGLSGPHDRFQGLFQQPVTHLDLSDDEHRPQVVHTTSSRVEARQGLVLAAGAWTGRLLDAALAVHPTWAPLFRPRRGHLLELQLPDSMPPLQHGLMEVSYTQHYARPSKVEAGVSRRAAVEGDQLGVTFTAAPSASGSLLLGSSREFSGWDTSPCPATVDAILDHAEQYLPMLSNPKDMKASCSGRLTRKSILDVSTSGSRRQHQQTDAQPGSNTAHGAADASQHSSSSCDEVHIEALARAEHETQSVISLMDHVEVRVGLRPYMVGGAPLIGPLPGLPHVVVAAGHEGSGLTLGPATAELVLHHFYPELEDSSSMHSDILHPRTALTNEPI
ncbi:hypothetical protein WJX74_007314 [Apatococcus lobatus]|uniref:FAD-dependent oxidoreductase domain-containing protein 1 n=1 Tax=Apatococcus lobatus TaxID=904363 RepID=A0AAW1QIJ1_9CHLO